ncbi:MAG: PKD domain-containing protein, partial [Actinobacteria bacterium]|nr:PKD domain-containing protein [Actinomycetota bacterium]
MDHSTRTQRRPRRRVAFAGLALGLMYCADPSSQNPPASDAPPNAVFTASCTELSCNFTDGSNDPDGTIVSRMWDYGDGSAHSDVAAHTYTAEGTYGITLTVTDDAGAHA